MSLIEMTENSLLVPADASANVFFDYEEETALIQSYIHTPLHFPPKEKKVYERKQVFNTESLKFEAVEEGEDCYICHEPVEMKYSNKGCGCSAVVCKDCVDGMLLAYHSDRTQIKKYQVCCNCRSNSFMPEIKSETINTLVAIHPIKITDGEVKRYRNEIKALQNIRENNEYFINEIDGKELKEMTTEQMLYWNVASFLCEDILKEEMYNLANRFYITDFDVTERMKIINKNNEKINDCLIGSTFDLLYRGATRNRYEVYSISVYSRKELYDLLLDSCIESPIYFPRWFVFEYCLKKEFKSALDGEDDPILDAVYENENSSFLSEMLGKPNAILEAIETHFDDLNVVDILGRDGLLNCIIKYFDNEKNEVVSDDVIIVYDIQTPRF